MARVVLAMSGGVDSSAAAHLLLEAGHEVIGVFMRHGEESAATCQSEGGDSPLLPIVHQRADHKQGCCSASDAEDARMVAGRLGIPFYALNLKSDFRRIVDYFMEEYISGRTPNPCVMCNNWIKFGRLFEYADDIGADYVATGHYAQLELRDGEPALCRGVDHAKDQSYVLFGIERDHLARVLLPVGRFQKPQIRQLAKRVGLRVADKKDSQEICFVASGKHEEFIRARLDSAGQPGTIVTTAGQVVGQHEGIEKFTIGQRKGLGVALGEPKYVVSIDAARHQVVIGDKTELARTQLVANRTHWLVDPPGIRFRCQAKIRYNSPLRAATAELVAEDELRVEFDEELFGVAPGQAVVCYEGDRVLGGGWILR